MDGSIQESSDFDFSDYNFLGSLAPQHYPAHPTLHPNDQISLEDASSRDSGIMIVPLESQTEQSFGDSFDDPHYNYVPEGTEFRTNIPPGTRTLVPGTKTNMPGTKTKIPDGLEFRTHVPPGARTNVLPHGARTNVPEGLEFRTHVPVGARTNVLPHGTATNLPPGVGTNIPPGGRGTNAPQGDI